MKPRRHIGWLIFAIAMVWGETLVDVPRLVLPFRSSPAHLVTAAFNLTAIIGLTAYAFGFAFLRRPNFWRIFTPCYGAFMALLIGHSIPAFLRVVTLMAVYGGNTPLVAIGALTVLIPIAAMLVFTFIALLRLGDWIGPTRRALGETPAQLSLPI